MLRELEPYRWLWHSKLTDHWHILSYLWEIKLKMDIFCAMKVKIKKMYIWSLMNENNSAAVENSKIKINSEIFINDQPGFFLGVCGVFLIHLINKIRIPFLGVKGHIRELQAFSLYCCFLAVNTSQLEEWPLLCYDFFCSDICSICFCHGNNWKKSKWSEEVNAIFYYAI